MQSLDTVFKRIQAVFNLQCVEGGSSKVEWHMGKRIQVVITSGMSDNVRKGMLFKVIMFTGTRY